MYICELFGDFAVVQLVHKWRFILVFGLVSGGFGLFVTKLPKYLPRLG